MAGLFLMPHPMVRLHEKRFPCLLKLKPSEGSHPIIIRKELISTGGITYQMKQRFFAGGRVTRLGEFSPIGRLFSLCRFLEKYKSSPKFLSTFIHGKSFILTLPKNELGYILGDFCSKLIWSPWLVG
jgi:hypothetical protein